MDFLRFLTSRVFLKNLLFAAIIGVILIAGTFLWLHFFTRHNQSITVPDLSGLTKDEVKIITESKKLRFEISDSIFYKELPKGTVAKQNPRPGSKVKENRRIYLTMNAVNPEKVTMPMVTGVSLRQARAILETHGLVLGKISYMPDIAVNVVLKQYSGDSIITPGEIIAKGSEIDLVLGKGLSNETTKVPDLVGRGLFTAKKILADRYLNIGAVIYDNTVMNEEDSTSSFIWKQIPVFEDGSELHLGSDVDVWLTVDSTKLPVPDSLLFENERDNIEDFFDEEVN